MMECEIKFVDTYSDFIHMLESIESKTIFLDLETTGLDHNKDEIRTLTVAGEYGAVWVVNWQRDGFGEKTLRSLINKEVTVVAQNVKFEYRWLNKYVEPKEWHDTLLLSKIVNPLATDHSLEGIAYRWITKDAFRAKDAITIKELLEMPITEEKFLQYAGTDVFLTRAIYKKLLEQVYALGLQKIARLEHDLLPIIIQIEDRGVRVRKQECLTRYNVHHEKEEKILEDLKNNGLETMGPLSVARFLQEKTGEKFFTNEWDAKQRAMVAKPKTGDQFLEQVHSIWADRILEVRRRRKVASTYYLDYYNRANDEGFLFPTFHQLGARTGRMSSIKPNLQNVPQASNIDDRIIIGKGPREMIIPREGNKLISADYSQIEPRIAARISQDTSFVETCSAGDIYEGIHENRSIAKMLVLAITYGAGVETLSSQAGISIEQTKKDLAEFSSKFPRLIRYKEKLISQVKEQAKSGEECYVKSLMGRRTWMQPREASTKALNGVIQSTAGDVLKQAIVKADKAGISKYFISLVHDEIIADVPEFDIEDFRATLKDCMEDKSERPFFIAESVVGESYADLK